MPDKLSIVQAENQAPLRFIMVPNSKVNRPPLGLTPLEYNLELLLSAYRDMSRGKVLTFSFPSLKYILVELGYYPDHEYYIRLELALGDCDAVKRFSYRGRGKVVVQLKRRWADEPRSGFCMLPIRVPRKSAIACHLYVYAMSWYRGKTSTRKYPIRNEKTLCEILGIDTSRGPKFMEKYLASAMVGVNYSFSFGSGLPLALRRT